MALGTIMPLDSVAAAVAPDSEAAVSEKLWAKHQADLT